MKTVQKYRFGAKLFYIIAENGRKYTFVTNIDADRRILHNTASMINKMGK